jgi:hypothetical protein
MALGGADVALRLLVKGQREMAGAISDISKQTGALGDISKKTATGVKSLSTSLGGMEKSVADASTAIGKSNAAIVKSYGAVADAAQAAAAADRKAAQLRVEAAQAVAAAVEKEAAGDRDGAAASREYATEMTAAAAAADKMAAALKRSTTASRSQLGAMKAQNAAMRAGGAGGMSRGATALGVASRVGKAVTKVGLGAGAFLGYEGAKQYGSLSSSQTRLGTMANVPSSQIPGLTAWEMKQSVGLRTPANALSQMAYYVRGSMAGTRVSHAIQLLSSPSPTASGVYASLGIAPTAIDQIIRSQGLASGLQTLQHQLAVNEPFLAGQNVATRSQLATYGFNGKQATAIQKQGGASAIDLTLSRAFGGARQESTVLALLQGLSRTNAKTSAIKKTDSPASYLAAFTQAANTPTEQWKHFDLDIQQLELDIGQKLVPDLISAFNWFGRNEGVIKDVGIALGVVAVPAVAAYAGKLANDGVSAMMNFGRWLTNTQVQIKKTGTVAEEEAGATGGIGKFGAAVAGIAAIGGAYAIGSATASHGAGGAAIGVAGGAAAGALGGAAIGSVFPVIGTGIGAGVGAAIGGLTALAAHFHAEGNAASSAATAVQQHTLALQDMQTRLESLLQTDKGDVKGPDIQSFILSQLTQDPALVSALNGYHVTPGALDKFISTGKARVGSPLASLLNSSNPTALNQLSDLRTAWMGADSVYLSTKQFYANVGGPNEMPGWHAPMAPGIDPAILPSTSGGRHHSHWTGSLAPGTRIRRANGGPLLSGMMAIVGENGPEIITPNAPVMVHSNRDSHAALSSLAAAAKPQTIQLVVDGKVLAEVVANHMLKDLARQ